MLLDKKTPYFVLAFALFLAFKYFFSLAETDDVWFILAPVTFMIDTITATGSIYDSATGFYNESLNIVIDRSCSGFNFWMICFGMMVLTAMKYCHTTAAKLLLMPAALLAAYLVTLFVNTSRIMVSLYLQHTLDTYYITLHQVEGTFIYLLFLLGTYLALKYSLEKLASPHAKLT